MQSLDIWQGSLLIDEKILKIFSALLDANEQNRARSFKYPLMRDRFIAVRGWLRTTLAHYLSEEPAALRFTSAEFGKPVLIGFPLYFNLSHSQDCLAIAISESDGLGIDIEQIKSRNGLLEIARRCFSKQEFFIWCNLPEDRQLQMFYQFWTRKEAFVKAVGRGIALGLDQCELAMPEARSLLKIPPEYGQAADWKIVEFLPDGDFCGALVVPNVDFSIRQFRFDELLENRWSKGT